MASRTPRILCVAQVVQDHHVARAQGGGEPLPDPRQKHLAVHRAFKKPRSARTFQANAGDQRAGLIAPVRDARPAVFVRPGRGPAGASSWCWLRFRPQTPERPCARRPGAHASAPFLRRRRGASRSAAARVFFKLPTQPPQPEIDRGSTERAVQARAQLGQGGVGLLREKFAAAVASALR